MKYCRLSARALQDEGRLTVQTLVLWCATNKIKGFISDSSDDVDVDQLAEEVELELCIATEHFASSTSRGCMEAATVEDDPEGQALKLAQNLAAPQYGWPRISEEPAPFREPGRFAKAFPLSFPMGIADMFDGLAEGRVLPVPEGEYVQHMLRHASGFFVEGLRGHREVWALVNTLLLLECKGKGHAVQQNVMRRIGGRLSGHRITTKAQLQEMIHDEEQVRTLVHQLMTVGRDVRSTPMSWAYEGKKLNCAVKHLAWRPPWLYAEGGDDDKAHDALLGLNQVRQDRLGRGRIPMHWFTQNCAYNSAFEIHRLNVRAPCGDKMLTDSEDRFRQARFNFIQDRPNHAAYIIALRAELNMRIVMRSVVPNSDQAPFLAMQRFECGSGANPHTHGFNIGEGNPRLGVMAEEQPPEEQPTQPVQEVVEACQSEQIAPLNDLDPELAVLVSRGLEQAPSVEPPPVPHPSPRPRRKLKSRPTAEIATQQTVAPTKLLEDAAETPTLPEKSEEFWKFFRRLVSEWNPCFTEEGEQRVSFHWDPELEAHDIEVACADGVDSREPCRTRLSEVLAEVLDQGSGADNSTVEGYSAAGERDPARKSDEKARKARPIKETGIAKLRYLVAALVQKYGRHDRHAKTGPVIGKHPCARGKPECPYCRYGFPHEKRPWRDGVDLQRGDREGQWNARFPRNDSLVCSYEPHVMLGNMGNVDWRPCLNLWAVVEYISKYATKAPEGSRQLGEVLRDSVDEVCKYTREGEPVDFLQKSLQKFYSRTLGDRDYTIFEAMYLGLRLPLVNSLVPMDTLNTSGTRALKSANHLRDAGPDAEISWHSKVDKFDDRLGALRRQFPKAQHDEVRKRYEDWVRNVSLYEFYCKYAWHRNRIAEVPRDVCLMVSPHLPAAFACTSHDKHDVYARMCVVAYWRCMSTRDRQQLWCKIDNRDARLVGATVLEHPLTHGASRPSDLDRLIGVRDLVDAFEGPRSRQMEWRAPQPGEDVHKVFLEVSIPRPRPYGWAMGLLEMIVDPILVRWVPEDIVEQYQRWNPFLVETLKEACHRAPTSDGQTTSNTAFLREIKEGMERKYRKLQSDKLQLKTPLDEPESRDAGAELGGSDQSDGDVDDESERLDRETRAVMLRDELPSFDADQPEASGATGDWANTNVEERLSAAGPAPGLSDRESSVSHGLSSARSAQVNPEGYDWESRNFVSPADGKRAYELWQKWRNSDVLEANEEDFLLTAGDQDVFAADVEDEDLDAWQEFMRDIVARRGVAPGHPPLRVIMTGTAGTGKSTTIRACVKARRRGVPPAQRKGVCLLAAPTGCASFHIKNGATTIHRAYGVPIHFCGPSSHKTKISDHFLKRKRRLQAAKCLIIDESSMMGRQMVGKMDFKSREALEHDERAVPWQSWGGKDLMLSGDFKQIPPIGDEPLFRYGAYRGKGLNKPKKGQAPPGTPTVEQLTSRGELLREEFEDVVILREVHRVQRADACQDDAAAAHYAAEADRFLDVVGGMANCTWTAEDYAWLSKRQQSSLSRTPEGRAEIQEFTDALLLMDGRRKNARGEDGAVQVNQVELFRVAERDKVPVLGIAAYHARSEKEKDAKPELMEDDDFQGLNAFLMLCVCARVLLTQNLWVEAGLMNGAMGTVRGFVWPLGGGPHAKDPKKRGPVCIIVEFDELNLGEEQDVDERGVPRVDENNRPLYRQRCFFPGLLASMGSDSQGKPRAEKLVPIFRSDVSADIGGDENVSRQQFPLILAWALTHWKAQGMTLRRAKVRLGQKIVSQPGVPFVASTRVKHPFHMMFVTDLPDYEHFQAAQWKQNFRARKRFEWRLEAKASRTLRKYGFCRVDMWSDRDADVAGKLLAGLKSDARQRRARLPTVTRDDPDAWCWESTDVPVEEELLQQARILAGSSEQQQEEAEKVARRLLGPWHRPAVLEAMGCLIPQDFHPRYDGVVPKAKIGRPASTMGVCVDAGGWKVDVFEEQLLNSAASGAEARLSKAVLEFFLKILRRLCDRMDLSVAIGTHRLGQDVFAAEDLGLLKLKLQSWESWTWMQESISKARQFLLPVVCDDGKVPRDCVLVMVTGADEAQFLGEARSFEVHVFDVLMRSGVASKLAENVLGVLAAVRGWAIAPSNQVVSQYELPCCASSFDRGFAVLGTLISFVAKAAGETFHAQEVQDTKRPIFVAKVRSSLASCFGALRLEADKQGSRDVLLQLTTRPACEKLLKLLCVSQAVEVAHQEFPGTQRSLHRMVEVSDFQPLKFLSWNISGASKSRLAPPSFSCTDKLCAVQQEIARWRPDIVALQECVGGAGFPQLCCTHNLVGASAVEDDCRSCGFVHLYVRKGLAAVRSDLPAGCPGVLARLTVAKNSFDVAAVHLMPGRSGGKARQQQLQSVVNSMHPGSRFVVGDMNVRPDEEEDLRGIGSFREAHYEGRSFFPGQTRYDNAEVSTSGSKIGYAFDRAFYAGGLCAEAFLVGKSRIFMEGVKFSLSDHYGVLGYLDIHASHSVGSQDGAARRERRGALVAIRDQACIFEAAEVRTLSQDAWQQSTVEKARADATVLDEAVRKQRLAIQDRKRVRDVLWERAFGMDSLFGLDMHVTPPSRACEILTASHSLTLEKPAQVGFKKISGRSLARVSAQVLLRIEKVLAWLSAHDTDACGKEAGTCAACALLATHRSLQNAPVSDKHDGRTLVQHCPLADFLCDDSVSNLCGVAESVFASGTGWPEELPWPGLRRRDERGANVFDALFSFVMEVRHQCDHCQHLSVSYERSALLELPYPQEGTSSQQTLSDSYLAMCCPCVNGELRPCSGEMCAGEQRSHRTQRRMLHLPEVLLVKVPRQSDTGGSKTKRLAFQVEDYVSFPLCCSAELVAVMYDLGGSAGNRRHACAVLGQSGRFLFCEDGQTPRFTSTDISVLCQSSVDLLVYVPRGEQAGFAASFGQVLRPTLASAGSRGQPAAASAVTSERRVGGGVAATEAARPASRGSERATSSHALQSKAKDTLLGHLLRHSAASSSSSSRSRNSRVPTRPDVGHGGLEETPLWLRMLNEVAIPPDVVTAILSGLQQQFGEGLTWELATSDWFVGLTRWQELGTEVNHVLAAFGGVADGGHALPLVIMQVQEVVFALIQIVLYHEMGGTLDRSDQDMLNLLSGRGFEWRRGRVWDDNNCLADSLLQLLEAFSIITGTGPDGSVTLEEREAACAACRAHLCADATLAPRETNGRVSRGAFLQHHRHAEAATKFFLLRFASGRSLPSAGICLHVHARYDTETSLPEPWPMCRGVGSAQGRALDFHLFVWTGEGTAGYHYDPLLLRRLPAPHVVVDEDDAPPTSTGSTAGQGAARSPELDAATASPAEDSDKLRPKKRLRPLGTHTHQSPPELVPDSSGAVQGGVTLDADLEPWEEELRKRFSPAHINSTKCLARVFGKGSGGQCGNMPKVGKTCGKCGAEPKHGFVTGRIPRGKWSAFRITDELVRGLRSGAGGGEGAPVEKPGTGGVKSAHLGTEPSRKRRASDPIVTPASSSGRTEGEGRSLQPGMFLKRRRGDGLGRRVDLSDPQKDEDAGAAIGEPQASGMRPQASLSSSMQARPTMSTSAPRIVSGFGAERCEDVDAQRRRLDSEESSRAATMSTSAPRIVSGFGAERCEDVDAQRRRLDREESSRHAVRRDTGSAGRARDFQNRDLDRGAGGAWHAGR